MHKLRKNLATKIRVLRGKQPQQVFSRKLGVAQSTLNRIEQGTQNVTLDTLHQLCKRLKCTASDLLDD